jgi:hypothetical protein
MLELFLLTALYLSFSHKAPQTKKFWARIKNYLDGSWEEGTERRNFFGTGAKVWLVFRRLNLLSFWLGLGQVFWWNFGGKSLGEV